MVQACALRFSDWSILVIVATKKTLIYTEVLVVHTVRKGAVAADDVDNNCDDGDGGDEASLLTMLMLMILSALNTKP